MFIGVNDFDFYFKYIFSCLCIIPIIVSKLKHNKLVYIKTIKLDDVNEDEGETNV